MAVKLRLARQGRKKAPFYHIVVADARAPRDGKFIEKIGTYNPMTSPATIEVDRNAAYEWLVKGAQPTDTVRAILRFKGVYYKRHLMRGLKKGALTVEQVDKMWAEWTDAKEGKITARKAQKKADTEAQRTKISGEAKAIKAVVDPNAANAFKAESDEALVDPNAANAFKAESDEVVAETAEEIVAVVNQEVESTQEEVAAEVTQEAVATEEVAAEVIEEAVATEAVATEEVATEEVATEEVATEEAVAEVTEEAVATEETVAEVTEEVVATTDEATTDEATTEEV